MVEMQAHAADEKADKSGITFGVFEEPPVIVNSDVSDAEWEE